MKPITTLLFYSTIIIILSSCKKDAANKESLPVDYTSYYVVKAIRHSNGNTDTTHYTYNGVNVSYATNYSYEPLKLYVTQYSKHTGYYTTSINHGGTLAYTGFYRLNNTGYVDSTATVRSNNTVNNIDLYTYNNEGYNTRAIMNFGTYQNDYTKYYTNGNCTYWINNFANYTTPSLSKKDSIVFEYYPDKLQHLLYSKNMPQLYGKPEKNLVKKRTYYNEANTIYQTREYEYETNSIGLVTREIWSIYNQPGNVVSVKDTTYFTYNK